MCPETTQKRVRSQSCLYTFGSSFKILAKVYALFSCSRTWRTTWRTRTVWSVSGRPCAPIRQSPAPAVWDGESRIPKGTAQTPWLHVSPFFFWTGGVLPFIKAEQCRPITNIIVEQAKSTQEQYVSNEIIRPITDLFGLNCSKSRKQRAFL